MSFLQPDPALLFYLAVKQTAWLPLILALGLVRGIAGRGAARALALLTVARRRRADRGAGRGGDTWPVEQRRGGPRRAAAGGGRRPADAARRVAAAASVGLSPAAAPALGRRGPHPGLARASGPRRLRALRLTPGGRPGWTAEPRSGKSRAMAKDASFDCTACGAVTSKWSGRCDACGAWNTIEEAVPLTTGPGKRPPRGRGLALTDLASAEPEPPRTRAGVAELDRVLGGGLVPASALLVGGDPGIGKSTLLLQASARFARQGLKVIYVSGEESAAQVQMRARRLGLTGSPVKLAAETNLADILATLEAEAPDLAVINSIQTMWSPAIDSRARLGQPGPRRRARSDPVRQAPRHGGRHGRPRHQGRRDRRPAHRRAHGRLRPLLRGRPRRHLADPARAQEPLRPGGRDRRLRDDRQGPDRGRRTPRPCSSATAAPPPAPRSSPGSRAPGRCSARSRPWSRPRPAAAARGAASSAGTAAGSR